MRWLWSINPFSGEGFELNFEDLWGYILGAGVLMFGLSWGAKLAAAVTGEAGSLLGGLAGIPLVGPILASLFGGGGKAKTAPASSNSEDFYR